MSSLQRYKLELDLESTVRDVHFSDALQTLLQSENDLNAKEEEEEEENNESREALGRRIDTLLELETSLYYKDILKSRAFKWKSLLDHRRDETNRNTPLASSFTSSPLRYETKVEAKRKEELSKKEKVLNLEEENLKLEYDYNQNWDTHEKFHLEEAFRLQTLKIDKEWHRQAFVF